MYVTDYPTEQDAITLNNHRAAYALEVRAAAYAAQKHRDQKRKYTGEPYVHHPMAVAEIVRGVAHTPEMLAAAWLHDTLEDTATTYEDLYREFGPVVARLVSELTDVSKPSDGNRAKRKTLDREHLAIASPPAKTIKLADMIDNTKSIVANDKKFARTYLEEKRQLLPRLREGDSKLWAEAFDLVIAAQAALDDELADDEAGA
jgi:guanosine-3',5'-bis(diphosphate) 3'-pyrophosphohydrolase